MKREIPLWTDPWTKKEVSFHVLDEDTFAVDTQYDIQDVVDYNADVRAVNKTDWKGENLVGRIPIPMFQDLQRIWRGMGLSKEERHQRLLKFISDPDFSDFKVKAGRL